MLISYPYLVPLNKIHLDVVRRLIFGNVIRCPTLRLRVGYFFYGVTQKLRMPQEGGGDTLKAYENVKEEGRVESKMAKFERTYFLNDPYSKLTPVSFY